MLVKRNFMLSVEKRAEYRRQNFTIIALDVRVERLSQSQQRPREDAAISGVCGSEPTPDDDAGRAATNLRIS